MPLQFQSSTRQTDFATPARPRGSRGGRCFNPLRGRQTLQPVPERIRSVPEFTVSILYEADRLCNCGRCGAIWRTVEGFNPLRGRQTLQHSWTSMTSPPGGCFNPLRGRQTLQPYLVFRLWQFHEFQSSTRQTDFATPPSYSDSIGSTMFQSSTRQTDFATYIPPDAWWLLQEFQSSTRQTDFATPRPLVPGVAAKEFQSSTRQTDFATPGAHSPSGRSKGFNPLRGRQTLQLPLSGSGSR